MSGSQSLINAVIGSPRPADHASALQQAKAEVDAAKLNVRDPEVMREALDAMNDEGVVFAAAEDIIELQQSGLLTQEDVANLNLSESVEDAAGRNADLEIKVSSLLTMPKDKFSELSQVVRENIASASSKESAQQLKDREATIAQLLEQMQQQKESVPDARPVYDTMRSNLISVNGMSEVDANEVASMIEEQYNTIAAEDTNGAETAEELFLRDHITLKKERVLKPTAQTLMQPGMPAFDEWFGGSQVANADGSPTVVYHGTSSDVDAFNEETRASFFGRGTYFTPDPKLASGYAGEEAGANVMPVYLSIANPYEVNQKDNKVFTTMGALRDQIRKDFGETAIEEIGGVEDISQFYEGVTQWLRDKGYDGISSSVAGSPASFIAFDPTQIKSVNNKGTFAATNPMVLNQTQALAQRFTSGKTSRRQVAATFKAKVFKPGAVNLDLGGGKFDDGTNYLEAQGVENLVFDPVNRDAAHNQGVLDKLIAGVQPETVTVNNVLNVVAEAEVRSGIIQQAGRAVADGGVVYFKIYEGDKKGKGKETKDGFQNNAKAATYMAEIKEHFGTVTRSGDILVATDPIDSGPAAWFTQLDGTGAKVLFQDAPLTKDVKAGTSLEEAQAEIIARVDSSGGKLLEFDQIDRLVDSDKIKTLTVADLVGMKIFPTVADRTAAGALYTGIEGAQLDMAIPLLGGPFFPLRISNWENNVIWANRGESVNSAKENKVTEEGATHIMVVMGDPNMHASNTTVSYAYFQTLFTALNDPSNKQVSSQTMKAVTELLHNWNKKRPLIEPKREAFTKGKQGQKNYNTQLKNYRNNVLIRKGVNEFPGFNDAAALIDYTHKISFDARKQIMKLMGNKNVEKVTGISVQKVLNATREQSLAGLGWGDGVLVLEIDKSNMFTKLGEEGTTPHPDFPLGLRGKVVGKLDTPIGWETLWQDWAKENESKSNLRRAFELSRPIVTVTKKLVNKIGDISAPGVATRAHARMVVDAVTGNWRVSGKLKTEGGLGSAPYQNAMDIADHGMITKIIEQQAGKEGLNRAIKDDKVRLAQLGDAHVYYGMERRGEDWALVGLINNDSGTEGLGETLAVLHAIENGVTIAVADQSTMEYNLLKDLGFTEDGDVLRWEGTDNDRADLTKRYLNGGLANVLAGGIDSNVTEAEAAYISSVELGTEGQPTSDGRRADATQAGTDGQPLASRAHDVAKSLLELTPKARANLGLTNTDKKNMDQMALYQGETTGPKGSFNQERDKYGNLQNILTMADGADKSTFLHEMGHFWLYQMKTRLANPKLTDQGRRRLEQQMTATKSWFARNSGDAWRDIQIIAKSAQDNAAAEAARAKRLGDDVATAKATDNVAWRDIQIIAKSAQDNAAAEAARAKRLGDAVAHAKANGGATYMKRVAENFMDGSLDYSTDLEIGYHELWARGTEAYLFEGRAPSEALRKPMNKFSTWLVGVYGKIKNLNVTLDPEIRQVFDRLLATDAAINEERSRVLYQIPKELRDVATEQELKELDQLNSQAQQEAKAEMQGRVAKELRSQRGAEYTEAQERITAEVSAEVLDRPEYAMLRIQAEGIDRDGNELQPGAPRLDRVSFEAIHGKDAAKKMPRGTFGKKNIMDAEHLVFLADFKSVEHMVEVMTKDRPSASVAITTEVSRQLNEQFGSILDPETLAEDAAEVVQNDKQIELMAMQAKIVRRLAREPIAKIAKRQSLEEGAPSVEADQIAASVAGTLEGFAETQGDAAPEQLRRIQIEEDTKTNRDQRKAQSSAVKQVRQVTRSMDTAAIKEAAKRFVLKLPIGKLTPARFRQTADRLANKAQLAIAARNYDEAADLLQQRTLNLAISKEVAAAQTKTKNSQRRHRNIVGRADDKQTRDKDLIAVARSILDKFDLIGPRRQGMPVADILNRLEETDKALHSEMTNLITALSLTADNYRAKSPDRPWRQMPLEEYITLSTQIDAILKKALDEASILAEGTRIGFEQVAAEIKQATSDIVKDEGKAKGRGNKWERKVLPFINSVRSKLDRMELWARRLDGGDDGPLQRYLVRPIRVATDNYHQARNDMSKQLLDILMPVKDELGRKTYIDGGKELDGYVFQTKGELIHFLLHTGNASNQRKLLLGSARDVGNKYTYKWTKSTQQDEQVDTTQLDAFIARMFAEGVITREDVVVMNQLWAVFEQTKPAAQKAHKAMHGHYFEEIAATSRATPLGELTGGYVPAIVDYLQIDDGAKREAVESMDSAQSAAMFPSTEAGFTKGRVDYNKPLNLDLSTIPLHLNKVLRFSHLGPAIRQASRLTVNRSFQAAVNRVDQMATDKLITPWLQRTARQTIAEPSDPYISVISTRASRSVGLQTMAGNLINTAQQLTGLITASAVVPPSLIAKHTVVWRKDNVSARQFIVNKSRFMNNRMYDSVNDMSMQVGSILSATTPWSKADHYAGKYGYIAQQLAQNMVDPIVWMAAYDHAVSTVYYQNVYNQYLTSHNPTVAAEKADAAAVLYADRVVRDTQTPLGPEDVSAYESGTAFFRLFIKFISYFNNMHNLSATEFKIAARNIGTEAERPGRRFMLYLLIWALPSIVAEGITMAGRGEFDDMDELDEEELAIVLFKLGILSQVKMVANVIPGVGQATNFVIGRYTDVRYDDRLSASPVLSIGEGGGASLLNVINDGYELATEQETSRSVARSVADILNAFGLLVGFPTNWFKKPAVYLIKIKEGDAKPDGPIDIVQGLLSGRDGTEE